MPVQCHIDVWNASIITGWALDRDILERTVTLRLMIGDRDLGPVRADQFRGDLLEGIGQANCAFTVDLTPFAQGLLPLLQLRVEGSEQVLSRGGEQAGHATRSPFGGLWIDRVDWVDVLRNKQREGLSDELAFRIFQFVRDGYVVIPGAVSREVVDAVNADIEKAWEAAGASGLTMETILPDSANVDILPLDKQHRYGLTKLLDTYTRLETARIAASAKPVVDFLTAIFEEPPRAFQQLHFTLGSTQPIHKDTAYVKIDTNPMAVAATWLALEDIQPDTGELEYYVGSHHAPDYKWGGLNKWMMNDTAEHPNFLRSLHEDADKYGFEKRRFLGKAGDVLIWHADLAHGGSHVEDRTRTRKSLVTHYTPASHAPFYFRDTNYQSGREGDVLFSSQYTDVL